MTRRCHHIWQPYADSHRLWQVCAACGAEEHVGTHAEALARTLNYIMGDSGEEVQERAA